MLALTLILIGQLPPAMPPLPVSLETRAAQAALPDAPVAEGPSAGVLNTPHIAPQLLTHAQSKQFVSLPSPQARSQSCAGGFCNQPAMQTRRYAVPAQPVRRLLFRGRR